MAGRRPGGTAAAGTPPAGGTTRVGSGTSGASVPGIGEVPGSIFTPQAPIAYVLLSQQVAEINATFVCRTDARKRLHLLRAGSTSRGRPALARGRNNARVRPAVVNWMGPLLWSRGVPARGMLGGNVRRH